MTESIETTIASKQKAHTPRFESRLFDLLFPPAIWGILLLFDFLQRVAYLLGQKRFKKVVAQANRAVYRALEIWGVKIDVTNYANLDVDFPYIIVSNHQSLFDIAILNTIFANHVPHLVYQKTFLCWIPSLSFNLRYGQNVLVDQAAPRRVIDEIERLGSFMTERGVSAIVFPEGTRATDGELGEFRYASLASLLQSAPFAEIVPVTIDGSWKLKVSGLDLAPRKVQIHIAIGAAIERGHSESLKQLTEQLHTVIKGALKELRREEAKGENS